MNAPALSPDAMRLRAVRASLDAIAPGQWTRVVDVDGEFIESRGEMGELLVLARFHPGATVDEVTFAVDAPDTVRFLLRLLDQAFREIRALKAPPPERSDHAKDFAAECAMKCGEPAFRAFLEEVHGLEKPLSPERVATKVRSMLGVTSRAELNNGGQAAERWKALRGEFEAWRRAGR
jgi:hypothetical protein